MIKTLKHIWFRYQNYIENAIQGSMVYDIKDITYWREKLFTNCIIFSIPISLLAIVPSVIVCINNGYVYIPILDFFILTAITAVAINKHINLEIRKLFVVGMLYLLSVVLIATLGSFGIGSIYLLAVSAFIALLFSTRIVVGSVVLNLLIYGCFAGIIYFKLFNSPLIAKYTIGFWLAYSANLLFLNIVVVLEIRHLINGLEHTIIQEAGLRKSLQQEFEEKVQRNEQLMESEEHYKSLFFHNPSPMWIFDRDTMQFLQVNKAAVRKYGYTEEEFLSMTIDKIRPEVDTSDLTYLLEDTCEIDAPSQSTVRHQYKNGQIFYAEVSCSNIPFKGKTARLVIARDITAQIQHIQAIEAQNFKLSEIAHMQSHIVRAPLCRILGLIDIINRDIHERPNSEVLGYLDESARELDHVIKAIVENATEAAIKA